MGVSVCPDDPDSGLRTPDTARPIVSGGCTPGPGVISRTEQPMGESLRMERQPGVLTLSEGDRRVLAVWAADCAERRLSLFEARAPSDSRPRDAIDGLRAFARGEMRIGKVRALSAQAHAAARAIGDPAAVAAARAAGQAAGVAHMAAHARGAAEYAAKAAGLAAPHDASAVADEAEWQQVHASPAVRDVLRRLPPRPASILGALISEMHTRLTRDR